MVTILLTLDDSDSSHHAALTAAGLFGDAATYLAVHVDVGAAATMWWPAYGYPYPVLGPGALSDPASRATAIEQARRVASEQAEAAGVEAIPIGATGQPAHAIVRAAREHGADVVVVGDHERSWFRTLLEGNVAEQLIRETAVPVLVVPHPHDGGDTEEDGG